jgi:Lysozyme like domain
MKLSASDIAQYAAAAGFTGNDLSTAVAVALAESGGDPQAFNPEGSYGLWQIYVHDHPEFAEDDLYDPGTNGRDAFAIYVNAGYSFTPWTTFKTGAYARYLPASQSAVASLTQGIQISPGVTVLPPAQSAGGLPSVNSLAAAAGQFSQVPTWVWIGLGALGLIVFLQE